MDYCDRTPDLFIIHSNDDMPILIKYGAQLRNARIIPSFYASRDRVEVGIEKSVSLKSDQTAKKLLASHRHNIHPHIDAYNHPKKALYDIPFFTKKDNSIMGIEPQCNKWFYKELHKYHKECDIYYAPTDIDKSCLCVPKSAQIPLFADAPSLPPISLHSPIPLSRESIEAPPPTTKKITNTNHMRIFELLQSAESILNQLQSIKSAFDRDKPTEPPTIFFTNVNDMNVFKNVANLKKAKPYPDPADQFEYVVNVQLDADFMPSLTRCINAIDDLQRHLNHIEPTVTKEGYEKTPISQTDIVEYINVLQPCQGLRNRFAASYRHVWTKAQLDELDTYLTEIEGI